MDESYGNPDPLRSARPPFYDLRMGSPRIYLDYVAAGPVDPAAARLLTELLAEPQANASSPHAEGRMWKDHLEAARTSLARALGCRPRELVFTSGATEAANLAVFGLAASRASTSTRIVASAVEHPAVLEPLRSLTTRGFDVVEVKPDAQGQVSASTFLDTVGTECAFAALMLANREMGAVMPIAEVGAALRERGIPLVCDASLGPGRLPCTPRDLAADVVLYEGHNAGGPSGTGVLFVRRGVQLVPSIYGGIQEEKLRPGAPFVPALVALADAFRRSLAEQGERSARYTAQIRAFLEELAPTAALRAVGTADTRLPGVVTLELGGIEGEAVMINMDLAGISVATGSTCALGGSDPSPTLLAMGFSVARAASTIRVSIGEGVDDNSMKRAASTLCRIVERLQILRGR